MIWVSLQKLPNNVGDVGKIIVAASFEWLPKVQKIAQSGHTDSLPNGINKFSSTVKSVFWKKDLFGYLRSCD